MIVDICFSILTCVFTLLFAVGGAVLILMMITSLIEGWRS